MKKLIRVISALGAGASLVWGIARTIKRSRGNTDDGGPDWPPKNAEAAARATPAPKAPEAPAAKKPAPAKDAPQDAAPAKAPVEDAAPEAAAAKPAVEPASDEPLVVKGVEFPSPEAVVAFVNQADADALNDVGIKGKAQQLVLDTAPIESVEDLAVPGIGRRTLQSLAGVGRE